MDPAQPPEQPPDSPPTPETLGEMLSSPELVKAAESDDFRRCLDRLPVAIVIARSIEDEPQIVYVNQLLESMIGLSMKEFEGKSFSILEGFVHEDDSDVALPQAARAGEDFLGIFRKQSPEGSVVLAQAYASVIESETGADDYRIVALVDVTEYERAHREAFEQQIRDKDLLLKELQHRVKNNLQLIAALIRLEARTARRGDKVDFDRLAGRIDALALLYQAISLDHWSMEVDLGAYLGGIASAAVRTYASEGVELDLKLSYSAVSVNVAMPVGLLINELLTNVFKHAFVGRAKGRILLECFPLDEQRFRVVFADDGIGFPAGVTWPMPGKLGALILQTLRENTGKASFRIESEPGQGAKFIIEFGHGAAARKAN